MIENYHRFLAKSFFELKGKEFWRYHKDELKKAGYPLSAVKLLKAILLELLDFRTTTRRLRLALRGKKGQEIATGASPKLSTVLSSIISQGG